MILIKNATLLLALIVLGTTTYAQVTFIPKAGIVFAKIQGERAVDLEYDFDNKFGFSAGAAFNFQLNKTFSLQPEVNFVQKGGNNYFRQGDGGFQNKIEHSIRLNYIELPVILRIAVGTGKRFYLNVGPFVAMGISGRSKFHQQVIFDFESFTREEKAEVDFGGAPRGVYDTVFDQYIKSAFDYGFHLGAGINFNKFLVDFRYGQSLPSISEDSDDTSAAMQFTIGIPIKSKKS